MGSFRGVGPAASIGPAPFSWFVPVIVTLPEHRPLASALRWPQPSEPPPPLAGSAHVGQGLGPGCPLGVRFEHVAVDDHDGLTLGVVVHQVSEQVRLGAWHPPRCQGVEGCQDDRLVLTDPLGEGFIGRILPAVHAQVGPVPPAGPATPGDIGQHRQRRHGVGRSRRLGGWFGLAFARGLD